MCSDAHVCSYFSHLEFVIDKKLKTCQVFNLSSSVVRKPVQILCSTEAEICGMSHSTVSRHIEQELVTLTAYFTHLMYEIGF